MALSFYNSPSRFTTRHNFISRPQYHRYPSFLSLRSLQLVTLGPTDTQPPLRRFLSGSIQSRRLRLRPRFSLLWPLSRLLLSPIMAELAPVEVYASGGGQNKTLQLWKTLLNWFSFFFQILLQILRRTPSWTRGGNLSFLWSSLQSSVDFKPLPAEILADSPQLSFSPAKKLTVP